MRLAKGLRCIAQMRSTTDFKSRFHVIDEYRAIVRD